MTPLYFGTPERRLYGVYHPASPSAGPAKAAVLCQPWGIDYDQAHRAMRELAVALAAQGVHVLRFDYFGTGDSDGDADEGDFDGWVGDIGGAMDELREISGVSKVTLIGLRLGALLATMTAANRPGDAAGIILWDPILHRNYLQELEDLSSNRLETPASPRALKRAGCQIVGHAIGESLVNSFQQLDLAAAAARLTLPVTLVISGDEAALARAAAAFAQMTPKTAFAYPVRPCWLDDPALPGGFVPAPIINAIVRELA